MTRRTPIKPQTSDKAFTIEQPLDKGRRKEKKKKKTKRRTRFFVQNEIRGIAVDGRSKIADAKRAAAKVD